MNRFAARMTVAGAMICLGAVTGYEILSFVQGRQQPVLSAREAPRPGSNDPATFQERFPGPHDFDVGRHEERPAGRVVVPAPPLGIGGLSGGATSDAKPVKTIPVRP